MTIGKQRVGFFYRFPEVGRVITRTRRRSICIFIDCGCDVNEDLTKPASPLVGFSRNVVCVHASI